MIISCNEDFMCTLVWPRLVSIALLHIGLEFIYLYIGISDGGGTWGHLEARSPWTFSEKLFVWVPYILLTCASSYFIFLLCYMLAYYFSIWYIFVSFSRILLLTSQLHLFQDHNSIHLLFKSQNHFLAIFTWLIYHLNSNISLLLCTNWFGNILGFL